MYIDQAVAVPLDGDKLFAAAQALRAMSAEVADKKGLSDVVDYLDSLGSTIQGSARQSSADEAYREITQALLANHFKSSSDMSHITQASIRMLFPGSTHSLNCLRARTTDRLNQFRVDLAFLLVTRDQSFNTCLLKFAWADSSPQGGFDFLLWKHRYVRARDLLAVAKALADLIRSPGGVLGGDCGPDAEVHVNTARFRAAANALVEQLIAEHLCVPFQTRTDKSNNKNKTTATTLTTCCFLN